MLRIFVVGMLLCIGLLPAGAQSYDSLWKQVEQARKKSLPQTAIKVANQLMDKAEQERNAPQLMKAYLYRESLQANLTPDSLYTYLQRMEQWVKVERDAANRAILHSLLAHSYALYAQSKRRELDTRTDIDVETPPEDIREWTGNLFFNRIDAHCLASLQDGEKLRQTSTDAYLPLVKQENGSGFYGHDLYHLLLEQAVSAYGFYCPAASDSLRKARIDALYREAIEGYQGKAGKEDATLLCTLNYWEWKKMNIRTDEEAFIEDYLKVLDSLISTYGSREVCAEAFRAKAELLGNRQRMSEALAACEEGLRRYPKYKAINALRQIRDGILLPSLRVDLNQTFYPGDTLHLSAYYRNLKGFTLQLYSTTLEEVPWMDHGINKDTYRKYARKHSSVHYDLQPLPDDGKHAEDMPYLPSDTLLFLPMPQEPGVYIVRLISDDGKDLTDGQFLTCTRLKVLRLDRVGDGRTEFCVVDAQSGMPVEGATLRFYSTSMVEKDRKVLEELTTNAQGKALLNYRKEIRGYAARKGEDTAMPQQAVYLSPAPDVAKDDGRATPMLTLLTDRALYRPGQTVYVKGVAYERTGDKAEVRANAEYEIVLRDANRQELASRKVKTNEFGSFSTEFTLPSACLNGQFQVRTKDGRFSQSFKVEEYKRPTIEIVFDPVRQAYRLGETVRLTGQVKAYNGRTVQEMPLAYTVSRRTPFRSYGSEKSLQHDTVRLDADGRFSLPIRLEKPEEELPRGITPYQWNCFFTIAATVTDEAGETRSASQSLSAGERAYEISIPVPEELCKEDSLSMTFGVSNMAGVSQDVEGTYRLYREGENTPALEGTFQANQAQDLRSWRSLPSAYYRLEVSVRDSLGREEKIRYPMDGYDEEDTFLLFSKADKRLPGNTTIFLYTENKQFDAEHPASFLFGTSEKEAYVLMDVFDKDRRIESRVMMLSDTLCRFTYPYKESYGDGLSVTFCLVKRGMDFNRTLTLEKCPPERKLNLKWEVFRDKLLPGQSEEWRLTVRTSQGQPAMAEMLALMYDASLDQLYRRDQRLEALFSRSYIASHYWYGNNGRTVYLAPHFPMPDRKIYSWAFDYLDVMIPQPGFRSIYYNTISIADASMVMSVPQMAKMTSRASGGAMQMDVEEGAEVLNEVVTVTGYDIADLQELKSEEELGSALPPSENVRTNFAETAFFYPQLRTNGQGEIVFSFTVPQTLTRWNFQGYAHTRDMLTGRLDASVVTAKEFMLVPNLPRFVRVGDETEITATLSNLTQEALKGTAVLTLFDPTTEKVISTRKQKFSTEAGRNASVSFVMKADDRYDLLGVRLVADAGSFSDGEQHLLPVLSDKTFLTETLPLPVRGKETRTFTLDSLFNRNSKSATHRRMTVEFTGNPAWYAVQALPALSEPTGDNAIDWAAALYANTLAAHIAQAQPRIKAVLNQWKALPDKESFLSRLQENQDVKNILLNESPWVMEATGEAERQARIATLFDLNRQSNRLISALTKLKELQGEDGAWSWYKGMAGSRQITQYITTLLARLSLLTGETLSAQTGQMEEKAFAYLHKEAREEYQRLIKQDLKDSEKMRLSSPALNYLYLIALSGKSLPDENRSAYQYFLARVKNELAGSDMTRKSQAAIILRKAGMTKDADECLASIREHLIQEKELGAHFAFNDMPYEWDMRPVPTHVSAMEALSQTEGNDTLLEEMKIWLLKQKQANSWDTPVATADAVYALLCKGEDLLANQGDVRITLGKTVIETLQAGSTAGLNRIRETFTEGDKTLKASSITVEKRDEGIAWGAVYAQYLSPISDVKGHGSEALSVEKQLYVERVAPDGKKSLQLLTETDGLAVGDKVVTHITIRLDRAMDFLHLKDQRASCFEPVGALSGYQWTNGTGCYKEVEDASTNFFFDHLGKGVYVLEHSYRVAREGSYQTGLATLQCAYAPEFAAHSEGGRIVISD